VANEGLAALIAADQGGARKASAGCALLMVREFDTAPADHQEMLLQPMPDGALARSPSWRGTHEPIPDGLAGPEITLRKVQLSNSMHHRYFRGNAETRPQD
jgi:hypothetical protein